MGMASRTQVMTLLFLVCISLIVTTFVILSLVLHINPLHLLSALLRFGPHMMYPYS